MTTITGVDAWEVLDSRGDPTVRVRVEAGDADGTFAVPAGASTGAHEAVERRDGDARYGGRGVREACAPVRDELAPVVVEYADQAEYDEVFEDTVPEGDGHGHAHEQGHVPTGAAFDAGDADGDTRRVLAEAREMTRAMLEDDDDTKS